MASIADAAARLDELAGASDAAPLDDVLELYDALPAVDPAEMLGEWDGGLVPTGHPGEGQLGALGWVGKTFRSADDVDPIVVADPDGGRQASDVLGAATLRRVEHRGVATATMVYDRHPIFDHFRRVDERTVLGLMDRKGEPVPLMFYLRRRA